MGLVEYLEAGAILRRETITLTTDVNASGSVNLGSAYILLSVGSDVPCRLRLYDDSGSLNNSGEIVRSFGDTNVSNSVALIGDFSMSAAGTYTVDPAMYGVVHDPTTQLSYYRIDGATSFPTITFNRYLLEDATISTSNRVSAPTIYANVNGSQIISGSLTGATVPRTYVFVSASITGSGTLTRLRLYSTSQSLFDSTELNRPFSTEPSSSAKILIDGIFTNDEPVYFSPKIIGANLRYMGNDLNLIRSSTTAIMGEKEIYYAIQSLDGIVGFTQITSSLYLFTMEN